jgi:UDP-2,3-diacylglucosamine hydrolase
MSKFKRVYLFSDLHLTDFDQPLAKAFLYALSEPGEPTDAVVLAGDIFEVLIGNSSHFHQKYAPFLNAVRTLISKGVSVFYIEGNHDFHLGDFLPAEVVLSEDHLRLNLATASGKERSVWIAHGDLVDQGDHSYLRMRALFRSAPFRGLIRVLSGFMIEKIAGRISRDAHRKSSELPEGWSEEKRSRLRSVFRGYAESIHRQGSDFVVLGHCHDLDAWGGFYWNMGYPPVHRQYLVYDSSLNVGKESIERRNFLGI